MQAGDDVRGRFRARAGNPKRANDFIQITSFQTSSEWRKLFKLGALAARVRARALARPTVYVSSSYFILSYATRRAEYAIIYQCRAGAARIYCARTHTYTYICRRAHDGPKTAHDNVLCVINIVVTQQRSPPLASARNEQNGSVLRTANGAADGALKREHRQSINTFLIFEWNNARFQRFCYILIFIVRTRALAPAGTAPTPCLGVGNIHRKLVNFRCNYHYFLSNNY